MLDTDDLLSFIFKHLRNEKHAWLQNLQCLNNECGTTGMNKDEDSPSCHSKVAQTRPEWQGTENGEQRNKVCQQLPVTSQVGRRWLSSSLCSGYGPSVMTSKLRMNMITKPSSFFTGTTSTIHRKQWPMLEEKDMKAWMDWLYLVKAFIQLKSLICPKCIWF